jgi:hypothetical protein
MEVFEERGSDLGERGILWERRLSEFISSPLYGIGFANDSSLSQNELYIEEGKVEPGSSWLLVLSMLGILGLMPFVSIFGSSLYFIFKSNLQPKLLPYLGSILIFFGIHMVGEGYVFAAGSGIIIYFWLILGVISIFQQGKSVSKLSIIVKNININNRHK